MNQALRYLLWRSFVGGWRVRLRRLKQPKYWLGLAGIVLYFGILVLPGLTQSRVSLRSGWAGAGLGGMLLLSFSLSWLLQGRRAGLGFSEAETELLFCAPLTRHQLVHYRLAKVQPGLLFSTLLLMIFTSFSWRYSSFLFSWFGCYLLFNVLHIQGLVAIVLCGRWRGHWYHWPLRLGVVALFLLPLVPIYLSFPGMEAGGWGAGSDGLRAWGKQIAAGQGAGVWLWPWLFLGKLPFTVDLVGWALRFAACVGLWGLGYWLVLRYGVGFEERELAGAKARSEALAAVRRGRLGTISEKPVGAAWFKLSPEGALWRVIAWKNVTSLTRHVPWGLVLFLFIFLLQLIVLLSVTTGQGRLGLKVGAMSLALGVFFALFGSQFIKEDLRADLSNLELIKSMPLASHQLVRGEIYGAAAVVWMGIFGFLLLFLLLFLSSPNGRPLWFPLTVGTISLMLVLSVLSLVTFFVDNALVLLFPAWILPGEREEARSGGVEQLGRGVVNMFVKMIALCVFSLLPGFFGGLAWFLGMRFKLPLLLPVGAGIFVAVMVIQIEMGILWLADLFERLDPTEEGI